MTNSKLEKMRDEKARAASCSLCFLKGFDASTEIHQQQISKLIEALEFAIDEMMASADKFQYVYPPYAKHAWSAYEKAQQALNDFKKWSEE